MDKSKIFFILILLIIFYLIATVIFDFLDIAFSNYSVYLYWMITVVLFILVLPEKSGNLFS